ncbi:MAG: DNA replication/repair protein RecF [Acidimicrobiia bacterium]
MKLGFIELTDFRSYRDCRIEPEEGTNVLVGLNAAGKTNFLEAVWYLSRGRSFRRVADEVLINDQASEFVVRARVDRSSGSSVLAVMTPRSGRRRLEVNGKVVRGAGELTGHLHAVLFFPDDLDVVKRGPAGRREFIDEAAAQLWPAAAGDQSDYQRALRQRNALVKRLGRDAHNASLDVWDGRLSQAGGRVMARRAEAIGMLLGSVSGIYARLAGGEASVTSQYRSTWNERPTNTDSDQLAESLSEALLRAREIDRERRVTTVGPHRDDAGWLLNQRETRTHLSQGEQRTLALALRLATREAILHQTGEPPVMLLDDVFSELDLSRAKALADVLPEGQAFITTTRLEEVPFPGRTWTVQEGTIR